MSKKRIFSVQVFYSGNIVYDDIEAENEDEAKRIAEELFDDEDCRQIQGNIEQVELYSESVVEEE